MLLNRKRKISHQEVDTIIHRLLKVDREDVTVDVGYKKQIIEAGLRPKESYKDIIAVEYKIPKRIILNRERLKAFSFFPFPTSNK